MTGNKAQCKPWRPVTYSAELDTLQTIWEAKQHNQTGRNLRCWK